MCKCRSDYILAGLSRIQFLYMWGQRGTEIIAKVARALLINTLVFLSVVVYYHQTDIYFLPRDISAK